MDQPRRIATAALMATAFIAAASAGLAGPGTDAPSDVPCTALLGGGQCVGNAAQVSNGELRLTGWREGSLAAYVNIGQFMNGEIVWLKRCAPSFSADSARLGVWVGSVNQGCVTQFGEFRPGFASVIVGLPDGSASTLGSSGTWQARLS